MSKYSELKNKHVLITGAASGIGLAMTQRFLTEGSIVIAIDNHPAALDFMQVEKAENLVRFLVDVTDSNKLEEVYEKIDLELGGINIVIANAGISNRHTFLNITLKDWHRLMDVNLHGVFYTLQLAAKRIKKDPVGKLIVTGSTNGIRAHQFYADYNAAKAAIMMLARTMALELAPGICVNAICPGYVSTPMQLAEYTQPMLEKVNRDIPMGRHAEPSEIAALAAFLASNEANYITGQCICIDGGETA